MPIKRDLQLHLHAHLTASPGSLACPPGGLTANNARQLGVGRSGPICLVNTDGYYDGFVQQIHRAHADKLLHKAPAEFVHVRSSRPAARVWEFCSTGTLWKREFEIWIRDFEIRPRGLALLGRLHRRSRSCGVRTCRARLRMCHANQ